MFCKSDSVLQKIQIQQLQQQQEFIVPSFLLKIQFCFQEYLISITLYSENQ